MVFQIETKVPYLVMGGKPLSNSVDKVSETDFWQKMKDTLGKEKFTDNENKIKEHLSKSGNFIEFGDLIFSIK